MTDLPDYLEKPLDEIDASVFSSDVLHDREAVRRFEHFLHRWEKEVVAIKKLIIARESEETK